MTVFRKLWRGEYSLPVAFWIFYCVGLFVCLLACGFVLITSYAINARKIALVICIMLYGAYWLVASVGVWQSARPYWTSPIWMQKIWGALARIIIAGSVAKIVLGWINGGALAIVQLISGDIDF